MRTISAQYYMPTATARLRPEITDTPGAARMRPDTTTARFRPDTLPIYYWAEIERAEAHP
jgi:hypothetical protein